MSDKREFPRKTIQLNALLKIQEDEISSIVRDITVKGILLEIHKSLEIGQSVELTLLKHEDLTPTSISGQVVRCDPLENKNFIVAISLLNPDDSYMMDTLAYIHRS